MGESFRFQSGIGGGDQATLVKRRDCTGSDETQCMHTSSIRALTFRPYVKPGGYLYMYVCICTALSIDQTRPAILQYKSASVFNIVRNPKYVCKYEDGRGPAWVKTTKHVRIEVGAKGLHLFHKTYNSKTLWQYTSVEVLIEYEKYNPC